MSEKLRIVYNPCIRTGVPTKLTLASFLIGEDGIRYEEVPSQIEGLSKQLQSHHENIIEFISYHNENGDSQKIDSKEAKLISFYSLMSTFASLRSENIIFFNAQNSKYKVDEEALRYRKKISNFQETPVDIKNYIILEGFLIGEEMGDEPYLKMQGKLGRSERFDGKYLTNKISMDYIQELKKKTSITQFELDMIDYIKSSKKKDYDVLHKVFSNCECVYPKYTAEPNLTMPLSANLSIIMKTEGVNDISKIPSIHVL